MFVHTFKLYVSIYEHFDSGVEKHDFSLKALFCFAYVRIINVSFCQKNAICFYILDPIIVPCHRIYVCLLLTGWVFYFVPDLKFIIFRIS